MVNSIQIKLLKQECVQMMKVLTIKVGSKDTRAIKETEKVWYMAFAFATVITTYWRGYRLSSAKKLQLCAWLKYIQQK